MALTIEQIRRFSRLRSNLLDKLTNELFQLIADAQNELYREIIREFLTRELSFTEEGKIRNLVGNYASTHSLDKIFARTIVKGTGKQLITQVTTGTDLINRINLKYFKLFDKRAVEQLSKEIEGRVLRNFGITESGKVAPESFLNNVLQSTEPINKVKNLIHQAIATESLITDLEGSLKTSIIDEGLLRRYMDSTQVTNIYDKYDRQTTREYGMALGLDYAIYQGGTIEDSRDFCIERNGKVFTRDEIKAFGTPADKFGGYTNKSAGEFKGKFKPSTKVYDPETDLGGYNCRHHLDWITYELAVILRPELKKAA